ncbi:NAD(P)H-dependent oxidoreductase [Frankia sp. AgB1.9]|uniref:NADPH-dependent FMN reductase n=1 Tax=unclassified Frankia TaxID=2632575 RepID=UPI00193366F8|nr:MULTISPECIES: NADPH-dependent FMN reductase [unclassified Frankia]MBL7490747.1 NAD(P)H-dependent oxidoreductase [Frankia sp. AgW1.1]MBL7547566.1 NAD(P)H-dependent oxidoreductase [Frankia sp. AgB1.9]MBL7622995.1 NAD(P)H-dependent oxidoreductase [Frankia sp. AgB1.8]
MPKLVIIIASTRPGRIGPSIGTWVAEQATAHGAFDVELVDLAEVDLPMFNEPRHPRLGDYAHDHTKEWAATVAAADAFVFVMPEYNHSFTAPLKNAIDFLSAEWRYKPVGFASYGGIAAGTRAVQAIKPVLTALDLVPVTPAIALAMVGQKIGSDGQLVADAAMDAAAKVMFDEIARWTAALAGLRAG